MILNCMCSARQDYWEGCSEGSAGSTVPESQLVWLLVQYLHLFLLAVLLWCAVYLLSAPANIVLCTPSVFCPNISRLCQLLKQTHSWFYRWETDKIHICTRIHVIRGKPLLCALPLLLCMWCVGTALCGCVLNVWPELRWPLWVQPGPGCTIINGPHSETRQKYMAGSRFVTKTLFEILVATLAL